MKKTISLVLVLALGLAAEVANADFTFGTQENLGPPVNSIGKEVAPSISADGLELYFHSNDDIWGTVRATTAEAWDTPVNLGPLVNSSSTEYNPSISADGLELYFSSDQPGGSGSQDIYVATRMTQENEWDEAVNLGSMINSATNDGGPNISADGLELYFQSYNRAGGYGHVDLWVATRTTRDEPWSVPVPLPPPLNTSYRESHPNISDDGLALFFDSERPGGLGGNDIWMATRQTKDDPWGTPFNIGPTVNSSFPEANPSIWADCLELYFSGKERPGGVGDHDIWRARIIPIVDLNGDGIVDSADMCIMVDHWGENYPLCDIGPMPWGDGIVDVQDLIVLAEHLFEGIPRVEPEEVNVDEKDDGSQVELEQGQILVVTLNSNPTTGYRWEQVETQESILEQMGEAEFKPSDTGGPPLVGAGGWEIFRFKAISAGQMTLQLVYHRPWEEGVEPLKTFSLQVVVH